jgi:uncharacterized protein YukE
MGDQFRVDHNNYSDVNTGLVSEVVHMDTIMDDLNGTLNYIDRASGGKATPLWINHQTQWNSAYQDMRVQLNTHTQSSIQVAEGFRDGDNRGANAML